MKKNRIALVLCVILLLSISLISYASLADNCRHYNSSVNDVYFSVQNHSSSLYTIKDGRMGWWPVIYYDDYVRKEYSCSQCGKRIPELDVNRLIGTHWEFAY
jgi:hypothetical protein